MKKKDFDSITHEFRRTIEEALKDIGEIKDELPKELLKTKKKIEKLEFTINKQKSILENFLISRK